MHLLFGIKPRGVDALGSLPNGEPLHSYLAITAGPPTAREGVMGEPTRQPLLAAGL
jgi:hypothetical protein